MSTFTFNDLLAWSERLPLWQRDALRRVVTGGISDSDIKDLASMARGAQGLPKASDPSPEPATTAHVPASGVPLSSVSLISIRDIACVNALSPGPVTFASEGLTVIYGDNASGKSGIVRILKKAAHARNPGGRIHPCVFEPDPHKPGSATIEFRAGATEQSYFWVDGVSTNNQLREINVFDASCAAVQIEENNRLAYTPELLQVFQDLATVCQQVGARLKAQEDALDNERSREIELLSLRPHTTAGALIANLSPRTDPNTIDSVCGVNDEDRRRLADLTRTLQNNTTGQAALLAAHARRLNELDDLTAGLSRSISDEAVRDSERNWSEANAAVGAAQAAREAFATNSSLSGVGTAAWKELWESARRYSQTIAYPTEAFPVTREDALCLLCQQPIDTAAAERLSKFEQFVQNDVQQRADGLRRALQDSVNQLRALRIPLSGTLQREAALRGTQTGQSLKAFIVSCKLRRRSLLRKVGGRSTERSISLTVRPDLAPMRASLNEEIGRFRAAAQSAERSKLQLELEELEDRIKVAPLRDMLKREVARLTYCSLLDRARNDCDTTRITRKAGEVANLLVTSRLRSTFARNLGQLGFSSAPVEVTLGAGSFGQYPYRISLLARQDIRPGEILSEGERTCVGLAGFLAELETSENSSAVVLDDPISSLDHHYRLRVARLLVESAKQRQIVVFTHDVVFLLMLTKYARKGGVALKECSLRRGGPRHGIPEDGPPWVAMNVNRKIGILRGELQVAAAELRKGRRSTYDQKAEWIYDRLRQSWERAVEEVLLNEVVVRFGDGVSTQHLKKLTDITDSDVQTVDSEMSYCSSFVHDESGAVNAGIPDPPVIEADIKRLDDWVAGIRKRRR